jgi:DNA-binding CsgD family transcriptional regulator
VSAATVPPELADVGVDEHLGRQLDLNLQVRSHTGATIRLDEVLRGDKPVLFTLNYFTCETLCSLQLNAVLDGLRALDWVPGGEFRVVTLSIDPNEDAALAAKLAQLTPQQFRVLLCLADGLLNKQIAHELGLAENTVKVHVTAILKKLECYSRTQAAVLVKSLETEPEAAP